mmetsp:Transcript_47259/g.152311  ORF Transcript_47259/g.152311 Transcript_47259/m.152311 type:complete len:380 (-) Transcript_47259:356-1495(-)
MDIVLRDLSLESERYWCSGLARRRCRRRRQSAGERAFHATCGGSSGPQRAALVRRLEGGVGEVGLRLLQRHAAVVFAVEGGEAVGDGLSVDVVESADDARHLEDDGGRLVGARALELLVRGEGHDVELQPREQVRQVEQHTAPVRADCAQVAGEVDSVAAARRVGAGHPGLRALHVHVDVALAQLLHVGHHPAHGRRLRLDEHDGDKVAADLVRLDVVHRAAVLEDGVGHLLDEADPVASRRGEEQVLLRRVVAVLGRGGHAEVVDALQRAALAAEHVHRLLGHRHHVVAAAHVREDARPEERGRRDPRDAQVHRHEGEVDNRGRHPQLPEREQVLLVVVAVLGEALRDGAAAHHLLERVEGGEVHERVVHELVQHDLH